MRITWIIVGVAVLALSTAPRAARACSAGPFDVRAATDVLVLGRIVAVEVDRAHPTKIGMIPAYVTMRVDIVLKGSVGTTIRFVDAGSAYVYRDPASGEQRVEFAGGGGACGTLDGEPVGQYIAIALARDESGMLVANRLLGVAHGSGPTDPALRWLLERHGFALPGTTTADPDLAPSQRAGGHGLELPAP